MNYKEGLEQLRRKINNGEVSAMIGAGFSKNVYKDYPLWDDLLHDMVYQLYQSEIDLGFQTQMHNNPNVKTCKDKYCQSKIKEITGREGYLDIVSLYIKKKGYREAVETYIEECIPNIDEKSLLLSLRRTGETMQLKNSDFDAHKKLLEGNWDNIYTTNYDKLLEITKRMYQKSWDIIRNSSDLSFNKLKKKIIKLHGDLCSDNNSFEFDGNHHHRYIISKEDYENYPTQHEAFTQLMRISLLQGTFCLFGFSGTDPNFIAWIKWVRDILVNDNNKNEDKEKKYKIFLIDMTDKKPKSDKQLFYENHKIFHIPLLCNEVKEIIGKPDSTEPKELINSLLDYLSINTLNNDSINYLSPHTYQALWSQVCRHQLKNKTSIDPILEQLYCIKPHNRIVSTTGNQEYLCQRLIKYTEKGELLNEQEKELLLLALQDIYYLPEQNPYLTKVLEEQLSSDKDKRLLNEFKNRSITLSDPFIELSLENNDHLTYAYEAVLRNAFILDFTTLKNILSKWHPEGTFIPKKALFLSLFNKEEAKKILLEYTDTVVEIKERYYATQLLNLINWIYPPAYSTEQYENQNIEGLYELRRAFIDKVIIKNKDIKSYGNNGETYQIGGTNNNYEYSLRVLQFLVEFPVFTGFYNYITVMDTKNWYKVFKNIFEEHPFPALFYSLQCPSGGKEIIKRIGQEYAYSDSLQTKLPQLLEVMLNALINKDTPIFLRDNLFEISKELFVTVKPNKWEKQFLNIWKVEVCPNYNKLETHTSIFRFVCTALQYIKSKKTKTAIISDCLERAKQNKDISIAFLYYLNISKSPIQVDNDLQNKIDLFVSEIEPLKEFTIAGNIFQILSPANIKTLTSKIDDEVIETAPNTDYTLSPIAYFAKKSKGEILRKLKRAIIQNKRLWDNGIQEKSASPVNFIKLSSLKNNIKWNKEETHEIYSKLKSSFSQMIESSYFKERNEPFFPLFKYSSLLNEMIEFIDDYEKELSTENDILEIRTSIITKFQELGEDIDVNKALLSDNNNKIVNGLNRLYYNILKSKIEDHEISINLLIDRILFKKKEGLGNCLQYLAYYMLKKYNEDNISKVIIEKLQYMLNMYTTKDLQDLELDVPSNAKYLIQLSESLHKMGYKSNDYWLSLKKSKRFNNL